MQTTLGVRMMLRTWNDDQYRLESESYAPACRLCSSLLMTNNIIELEVLVDAKTIEEGRTLRHTLMGQIA